MPNQLYQTTLAPAENIQITAMGVSIQVFLHKQRQRAEPLSHVGMASRQPNASLAWEGNHDNLSDALSALITADSVWTSGAPSIVTRTLAPKAIEIVASGGPAVPVAASGVTASGTKDGSLRGAASCWRQR